MSDAESIPLDLAVEAITSGLLRAVEAQSEVSGFAFDLPILSGAILTMGNPMKSVGVARKQGFPVSGSSASSATTTQGGAS